MLHARPEEAKGRNKLFDDGFTLNVSDDICNDVRWGKKEGRSRAFENENIVRPPDVVKGPPVLPKLEKYPALIINENINRVPVFFSRPGDECGSISGRKCTFIKLGILGESKAFLVLVMAEVPKNVWHWQPRSANERL
jgi:hypothetical protein